MGLLSSPPPASTMFHQSDASISTTSMSETQLSQSIAGPSRGSTNGGSTNGRSTGRPLASLENSRATPQGSSGLEIKLVNGDAEHLASSEPNGTTFKPQNVSRARTENQQAFAHRPRAMMTRSRTNYEPEDISASRETSVEGSGELRHGWEDEYNSSEFLGQLSSVCRHM